MQEKFDDHPLERSLLFFYDLGHQVGKKTICSAFSYYKTREIWDNVDTNGKLNISLMRIGSICMCM
ncbi:hypothetical protein Hanom_Chr16g01475901 [Helianthus anomalus]